jgi:hypothetical protein
MTDILSLLASLRRPNLLVTAARLGAEDYSRPVHLRRLLPGADLPGPGAALMQLMAMEAGLEEHRRIASGGAGYSPARHIEVLAAIMAEARSLAARRSPAAQPLGATFAGAPAS